MALLGHEESSTVRNLTQNRPLDVAQCGRGRQLGDSPRRGYSPQCARSSSGYSPPRARSVRGYSPPRAHAARGYSLVELIIVMAIISLLVTLAIPVYTNAIRRTNESVLKDNLALLRTSIDEYTFDRSAAPQTLDDLVSEGYINDVPVDPITKSNQTWVPIIEDSLRFPDQTQSGIFDVQSGSSEMSMEGTPYSEW